MGWKPKRKRSERIQFDDPNWVSWRRRSWDRLIKRWWKAKAQARNSNSEAMTILENFESLLWIINYTLLAGKSLLSCLCCLCGKTKYLGNQQKRICEIKIEQTVLCLEHNQISGGRKTTQECGAHMVPRKKYIESIILTCHRFQCRLKKKKWKGNENQWKCIVCVFLCLVEAGQAFLGIVSWCLPRSWLGNWPLMPSCVLHLWRKCHPWVHLTQPEEKGAAREASLRGLPPSPYQIPRTIWVCKGCHGNNQSIHQSNWLRTTEMPYVGDAEARECEGMWVELCSVPRL